MSYSYKLLIIPRLLYDLCAMGYRYSFYPKQLITSYTDKTFESLHLPKLRGGIHITSYDQYLCVCVSYCDHEDVFLS
jgi:hypothetical protein